MTAGGILLLLGLQTIGLIQHAYVGLVTFVALPVFFLLGLALVPIGMIRPPRNTDGEANKDGAHFPILDFNRKQTRSTFSIVALLSFVNLVIVAVVSFEGVHYTESTQFCGAVCHTPMEPQFTALDLSLHADLGCVDCHVAPGVSGFVSAKLSGLNQLWGVVTDSYERPIHAPPHKLLSSSKTCEQCHNPLQDQGDMLRVIPRCMEDEENSRVYDILLMHVGGGNPGGKGIHDVHANPNLEITFLARDASAEIIDVVRVTDDSGETVEYRFVDSELTDAEIENTAFRTMDCTDCHNRVGHDFPDPAVTLDALMASGVIDETLPSIKRVALAAITDSADSDDPGAAIEDRIRSFFEREHGEVLAERLPVVETAIEAAQDTASKIIFPAMKVTWKSYPDRNGHVGSSGCYRCHDESHESPSGAIIAQDCSTCHSVLAWEEENPEFLEQITF